MAAPKLSKDMIGTRDYYDLLRREAGYWERANRGEIDTGVATWSRPEISQVVSGDFRERLLDIVAGAGGRVLDLGCGNAWYALELARRGCIVHGTDISFGRISGDRRQAAESGAAGRLAGEAHFFVGDLNRLGLASDSYDVVVAAAVLHHVLDIDALLDRVAAALKPGGLLVCLDHLEPTLPGRVLRYGLLTLLPTEVPYRRKPRHAFNRLMARVYRRLRPAAPAPAAYTLPESSPFEDITGSQALAAIGRRLHVETYETRLAFADTVAGHLRTGSAAGDLRLAGRLRRLDDWFVRHAGLRGETYFLVARKAAA